jgi:hypothetical protein
MATVMTTDPAVNRTVKPRGPSPQAVDAFAASVIADKFDEATCDAVYCTPQWWRNRRALYLSRVKANATLTEVAATQEATASEAARVSEAAMQPLPDSLTLGEIRERVAAIDAKIPTQTIAQLAVAFGRWVAHVEQLHSKVRAGKQGAHDAKYAAEQFLFQNCGEHGLDPQIDQIQRQTAQVQARADEHRKALRAGALVAEQRKQVERIAAGELGAPAEMVKALGREAAAKRFYFAAKARLAQAIDLAARQPEIEAAIERDQAELAKLQDELQDANEVRRQRMIRPENMAWCE